MMRVAAIRQATIGSITKEGADLVLCSSGYERRSSHLAERFSHISDRLVCIGHSEYSRRPTRLANDKIFSLLGYASTILPGGDVQGAHVFMNNQLNSSGSENPKVVVDISCMTRAWYGGFIHSLAGQVGFKRIRVTFVYVPALFHPPSPSQPPNEVFGPLDGFASFSLANKPTALVIGLGLERSRATAILEEIDPLRTIAFYADPSVDERFSRMAKEINKDFLAKIDRSNSIPYPLLDPCAMYSMLDSSCAGLAKDYRLVLTSIGPKVFGLCGFLVATRYPEISVWRTTPGIHQKPIDHLPSEHVVALETEWSRC